jgi:hypothetical protein
MFSLDNFYAILHEHLLKPVGLKGLYFFPFGSTSPDSRSYTQLDKPAFHPISNVLFYDQEPILEKLIDPIILLLNDDRILANSEHSELKRQYCKEQSWQDWYYFYHGLAALDWFRDFQYIPLVEHHPSRVFITFNNLTTQDRSYRLNLLAQLIDNSMDKYGHVSCKIDGWRQELISPHSQLSVPAKKLIYNNLNQCQQQFTIDSDQVDGTFSAKLDLATQQSALWHIVTETVFYHSKLHLTEKVFKPIVSRRPFVLLAAPGNLSYLRSYGFETFDRWIDETYDTELDNDLRIKRALLEIKKFENYSTDDMLSVLDEMRPVIQHNFEHLYYTLKPMLIKELLGNYKVCLDNLKIKHTHIDFKAIQNLLSK